jgi:regulator of protease activity HflC (stomatin/prohibitin superfamily)
VSSIVIAVAFVILITGSRNEVKNNEIGVRINLNDSIREFSAGEKPFVLPYIQEFVTLPAEPVTLLFVDNDSATVYFKDNKKITVESQITYVITDASKVMTTFGKREPLVRIRSLIKEEISGLIKEKLRDASILDTPQRRTFFTADMHIDLNNVFKNKGLNILNYQFRSF